ncbi:MULTISPECIES: hypothetical protein [Streptomyces]|uniref:hypothetical protein n=1 Tax=Streptomyces TaxID=1883 RepID=UPI0029AEE641|nr:hypothetical protein [Streptomyces sp. WI03-4A]MDX2592546.1 hypothetical protein [Streptomyces sp. WI03-4A]
MTHVVDADELLRRIRRGRDRAAEEERAWQERARSLTATDPDGAREAAVRALAFEAVQRALEEIVDPGGADPGEASATGPGVKRVT